MAFCLIKASKSCAIIFDDNIIAAIMAVFFINIKRFGIKFLFVVLRLKKSIAGHKQ